MSIVPTAAFLADRDVRRRAIAATSDGLRTTPPREIRGHFRLRLDGPGDAIVGLCLLQGKVFSDFIAGIRARELWNSTA